MKKILLLLLAFPLFTLAQQRYPEKPLNYITDSAYVLSPQQEKALNRKLHVFQDSTSSQILVFIDSSLNGQDLSAFGQQLFEKWDIGQKGKNNGILIAVFVKDHKFRIHTGYGMEGALPDLLTKKIQDEEMRPSFKQNNYYEGINKGIDKLIYYSKNEYKAGDEDAYIGFIIIYAIAGIGYFLYFLLIRYIFKDNKPAKIAMQIIGGVIALIPVINIPVLWLGVIITSIVALIKQAGKNPGKYSSGGSGSYYSYSNDNSWSSSSSSSDSDYSSSSSSDSDSSYSSGGGGDSGGGGSNSDW